MLAYLAALLVVHVESNEAKPPFIGGSFGKFLELVDCLNTTIGRNDFILGSSQLCRLISYYDPAQIYRLTSCFTNSRPMPLLAPTMRYLPPSMPTDLFSNKCNLMSSTQDQIPSVMRGAAEMK
jgi:hypothetical protein